MKKFNRYKVVDTEIVDVTTGEYIDRNEIKRSSEEKLIQEVSDRNRIMKELGFVADLRVVKDKNGQPFDTINIKENHEFNKTFRVDVRYVYENTDLKSESFAFIGRFSPYLHFPSNSVIIGNDHPSQEEMAKALKFGRTKLNSALKNLEYYDVIKRKKINGKVYIYFNPFLFSTGVVSVDTYKMFRDSIYNPYKGVASNIINKEDETVKSDEKSVI